MKNHFFKLLLFLFFLIPVISYAHQPEQSFIYLRVYENNGIDGRFELNVNELNSVLGYSFEKHPSIEDVRPYQQEIQAYLLRKASFASPNGKHRIVFTGEMSTLRVSYGSFMNFHFHLENSETLPDEMTVTNGVFIEENSGQRNFLTMEYNWKAGLINNESLFALDFTEGSYTNKTFSLTDASVFKGFMAMVRQGVWHIWIGLDHILFLVALILPAVVRRRREEDTTGEGAEKKFNIWGWYPVKKFRPAFMYIIKIVTFFTIAHTITLSLASLKIVTLPSQIVESIIAFSIGLAAYHNIKPIFKGKDWVIAFIFGLFHGFGFASVLGELGFKGEFLTLSLLGFNIGVEIGQLAIIAGIFPILFLIRKLKLYPKFLVYMSVLLIIVSIYWMVERILDVNLGIEDSIRRTIYDFAVWLGLR
ncbi:HupE/UreJ family protein [Spongiimicrobium salis]|uniref:HupE/UreJ family protein n=1 Tax=Spongiimicrobium salis TaxID=1667022 RepID=UPI00374D5B0D